MKPPADLNGRTLCADTNFMVPMLPPSANHYVKHTRSGRHYVTTEVKAFMQAVAICSKREAVRYENYFIEIYLNLGPKERMDVDNCAKMILDSLSKAGIIHSDAAVTDLALHKRRAPESNTYISIWQPAHDVVKQGRKRAPDGR